MTTDIAYQ